MTYTCPNVLHYLELVAPVIPFPIYWTTSEPRVLGANQACLDAMGAARPDDVIGQTPYDYYPADIAKSIVDHIHLVIKTGKTLTQEDVIQDISTGKTRYYTAIRSPLIGEDGKIVGVVGTSIEITAAKEAEQRELDVQKEAEKLRIENERQQIVLEEQEKFSALARNVAHDIKSPLNALQMMIGSCNELEEEKRIALHRSKESILDIANNLIANYQIDQPHNGIEAEPRRGLLVSDLLVQLLSEKKVEFRNNESIRFEITISENAQFAFIRTQKSEFRRAISNLINNAVDALKEKKEGKITVSLTATSHAIKVSIEDNGEGMSARNVQDMERGRFFTKGKEDGHGLGLQQVWGMLRSNRGRLAVQSELDQGTTLTLTFPRVAAARWIAQGMYLTPNHTIVILDDEQSIHDAWNMHFAPLLSTYPKLRLRHFTQGHKALSFINGLARSKKDNVMLLSDYELLHQPRNGIEIIQASKIKQSILVTSHYTNPTVRDTATKLKIKILPKQMASIIPIHVA
jgi:signal transduction histidine kinase